MGEIITLPGLIDPHVHLRDPGQTHKEDFFTGTSAALAGGFTTVVDMPNNIKPVMSLEDVEEKILSASKQAVCDIGFYFGTLGDNFAEFDKVLDKVKGLKIYLNTTTGNYVVPSEKLLSIYRAWPETKPILLHVESENNELLETVLSVIRQVKKQTHICHISSKEELMLAIKAKEEGLPVSCGVTPTYLFLTQDDKEKLGPYLHMKPGPKTKEDQRFLWENLDSIDIIETDHAPHTKAEKDSPNPPFGVPGLETALPLMLTAEQQGKISRQQIIDKMHSAPARLLSVKTDDSTKIEIDMSEYEIKNEDLKTKCGWSPFAGRKVVGKVQKVFIRGNLVYENGKVLAAPGSGRLIS